MASFVTSLHHRKACIATAMLVFVSSISKKIKLITNIIYFMNAALVVSKVAILGLRSSCESDMEFSFGSGDGKIA